MSNPLRKRAIIGSEDQSSSSDPSISHRDVNSSDTQLSSSQCSTSDLISVAIDLLHQGYTLLETTVVSDSTLSASSNLLPGSSVGKHLRHIVDHYRLLLDAVERDDLIDYDSRGRNVPMETDHSIALQRLKSIAVRLDKVRQVDADKRMRLSAMTPNRHQFDTTFGRELWFASLHAIHHYSLIRVIVTGELGLSVTEDFGVAPSTLVFRSWRPDCKSAKKWNAEDNSPRSKL